MSDQLSSAQGEPMAASGQPDYAQDAPVTLRDRLDNDGIAAQSEPVGPKMRPAPMGKTGDPMKGH